MATKNTSHSGFHATALAAVNEALVTLGQDVILDELSAASGTPESRKAAFVYEGSRLKVLRDHAWGFARRQWEACGCAAMCDGCRDARGGAEFPFAVPPPPGCVRLISCRAAGGREAQWRLAGGMIRSDVPVATVAYVADVQDLDRWSPDAYRALVLRLAADLAKPVTGRISERQLQDEAYAQAIADAKLADARESNVRQDPYGENHYVEAMRGACGARAASDPFWHRR